MGLLDTIAQNKYKSISVIGMAKNAGKTVTLNYLIDEAYSHGVALGITSIGRDGETLDLVTQTDKPTIYVYEGTLIATAEGLFEQATARMEIVHMTDIQTAMGKIIIAKIRHDGYVQIAGPSTTIGIQTVALKMQGLGADVVLVDGALDRKSLASPSVTDATILATGAVLSRNMNTVIDETAHRVRLFGLEKIKPEFYSEASSVIRERNVGLMKPTADGTEVKTLALKTALGAGRAIAREAEEETTHILLPGSLGEKLLADVLEVRGTLKGLTWVVKDATRIFLHPREWSIYTKRGLKVEVCETIHLIGVTVNPTAPAGYSFDADLLRCQLEQKLIDTPVYNVKFEETTWNF